MASTEKEIKSEIKAHIEEEGSGYSNWYVGISNNPKRRLGEHNVDTGKGKSWYIIRFANSDEIARNIEKYFIGLGTDGGDGGGDEDSKGVYAYRKTSQTNP